MRNAEYGFIFKATGETSLRRSEMFIGTDAFHLLLRSDRSAMFGLKQLRSCRSATALHKELL